MNKKKSKKQEYNNFSLIAKEWWKPDGKFKILHKILPIRIDYILNKIEYNKIKGLKILDLGCGGGLTCEPLARLGASVTGVDFVDENIRANSICPGTVNTPWVQRITQNYDNPEEARELMRQRQPLGRLGEPDEIAMAAVYLASDESKFITGTSLIIDGGLTMS